MRLSVSIRHALQRVRLDVDISIGNGLTALLGPSGAGKSSTLDVIAGLMAPDSGHVTLDDTVLTDSIRGVSVPPHRRRVGYVFQDSRLFPHLTVRANLGFSGWFRRSRVDGPAMAEVVDLLDLAPLLARHPARLSGGEQRRVALGRALLSDPRVLLLDEPLGSVDIARREEILPYLDRLIATRRIPMIYVTHDWREVEGRAQQIIMIDEGRARSG